MEFLISIHTDKRLMEYLLAPKVVVDSYGYTIIPKRITCDHCEEDLPITKPGGYALFDNEGQLWELLCEDCRRRFHSSTPVYESLFKALSVRR